MGADVPEEMNSETNPQMEQCHNLFSEKWIWSIWPSRFIKRNSGNYSIQTLLCGHSKIVFEFIIQWKCFENDSLRAEPNTNNTSSVWDVLHNSIFTFPTPEWTRFEITLSGSGHGRSSQASSSLSQLFEKVCYLVTDFVCSTNIIARRGFLWGREGQKKSMFLRASVLCHA